MNAAWYDKYGPPEVLGIRQVDLPQPNANEVQIKIKTSSINSWDWDLLRGSFPRPSLRKPRYPILGADIAGVVEEVGPEVIGLQSGDAVFGDLSHYKWGGFAEFVCAPEKMLALKPQEISFEEAVAIPQAGVLALQALKLGNSNDLGQRILINGAGGGVGTFAIQIGKFLGAEITAVDFGNKLERLEEIGADVVINTTDTLYTHTKQQYDHIIDVVGNQSVLTIKNILTDTGRYTMVGGPFRRILQTFLLGLVIGKFNDKQLGLLIHEPNREDLMSLGELYMEKVLKPVIDSVFQLSEITDAFKYYERGEFVGKIIIKI